MGYKTYTCPVGGECGACEWLNVPYPLQLKRKKAAIEELLAEFDVPVHDVLGMDEPLGYRAKIQSPFVRGRAGKPHFGMYAKGTHRLVESEECLAEHPAGRLILRTIAELAQRFRIAPYDERTGTGLLRHAIVRVAQAGGQVMVTLVVNRKEFPHKKAFVAALRERHPDIATVVFNVNTRKTNAVLGPLNMVAFGQGWVEDELCGCRFRIPAGAFYQTNPRQTEVLYDAAVRLACLRPDDVVLDAYCGIGTIGIVAAKRSGCAVVGVEAVPEAAAVAVENARINRVKRAEFVEGDAGEFLAACEGSPDVVLMDPPRAGASGQFVEGLLAAAPQRVVYVSCNPKTQLRDLRLLSDAYAVEQIVPVDMFPHTKHLENVVSLRRRG